MYDFKEEFVGLYKAVADCEPPEESQLAEVLDEYQPKYHEVMRVNTKYDYAVIFIETSGRWSLVDFEDREVAERFNSLNVESGIPSMLATKGFFIMGVVGS